MAESFRVLIVEDDPLTCRAMTRALLASCPGTVVCDASDGNEGLALLLSNEFDCAFLDHQLPGRDGLSILREATAARVETPIIIVTARGDEELAVQVMKAGGADYLSKSRLGGDCLAQALQYAVRLRNANREAARKSELLSTIFDHIPVMLDCFDAQGRLLMANREWERLLGWTVQEAQQRDILAEFYPDPAYRQYVLDFIRSAEHLWGNFCVQTRDGKVLDTSWANVRLSDGTTVGIGQDITESNRLKEQLLHAQKMEAIGRLAGGVAHDFNNVLAIISGYGDALARRLGDESPLHAHVAEIQKAAERGAALTRQLLAFSRRQMIKPQRLDLRHVVTGISDMLRRVISDKVELVLTPGPPCMIQADAGQIEQVVVNLALNAHEAMPQGGTLRIDFQQVQLSEKAAPLAGVAPGAYVKLIVADTGTGMDDATRARIFEPFFTTKEGGTGLGLSIAYGIIQQYGGNITVQSTPGKGTTFEVYLPTA